MTASRRAIPTDREAVVATVIAAFEGDPAWDFITADEQDRVAPYFAGALFDLRVEAGTVWVTEDCAAVAMWERREAGAPAAHERHEEVWSKYRIDAGDHAWERLEAYEAALDVARPVPPYWYLGVLATRPDLSGRGLASCVMRPVLEMADHEQLDCWLETSKPGNLAFYDRRGFSHRLEVEVPDGPPTWWMRRAPA